MVLEELRFKVMEYISTNWTFAQVSQDAIIPQYQKKDFYYHCNACQVHTRQQIWFNSNTIMSSWYLGPIYFEKPSMPNRIYIPDMSSMLMGKVKFDDSFFEKSGRKRYRFTDWIPDGQLFMAYQLLKRKTATPDELLKLSRNQSRGQDDLYALVDYIINEKKEWDMLKLSFKSAEFIQKIIETFSTIDNDVIKRDVSGESKSLDIYKFIINDVLFI